MDLVKFSNVVQGRTIELLGQKIEAFNANSGGAIRLTSAGFGGDFSKDTFFQTIAGAQRRVNLYGDNNAVMSTALNQAEETTVKVAGGFGPVEFDNAKLNWIMMNPKDGFSAISEGFANALLADQLNTSLLAAVAALKNNVDAYNDQSAAANAKILTSINLGHGKLGDMGGAIVADVMHSAVYRAMIGDAIINDNRLFTAGNVTIVDILGKKVVVTDSPSLFATGTPAKYHILHLTADGLRVTDSASFHSQAVPVNGLDRTVTSWQADYNFGVRVKGYAWDQETGSASPTNALLGTGANWNAVKNVKFGAGSLTTVAL